MTPLIYVFVSTFYVTCADIQANVYHEKLIRCFHDDIPLQQLRISTSAEHKGNEEMHPLCDFAVHQWEKDSIWISGTAHPITGKRHCIFCGKSQVAHSETKDAGLVTITTETWEDVSEKDWWENP